MIDYKLTCILAYKEKQMANAVEVDAKKHKNVQYFTIQTNTEYTSIAETICYIKRYI